MGVIQTAEAKKAPEKRPKAISDDYLMGTECKTVYLCEAENPEQLINIALHYLPLAKLKFV